MNITQSVNNYFKINGHAAVVTVDDTFTITCPLCGTTAGTTLTESLSPAESSLLTYYFAHDFITEQCDREYDSIEEAAKEKIFDEHGGKILSGAVTFNIEKSVSDLLGIQDSDNQHRVVKPIDTSITVS